MECFIWYFFIFWPFRNIGFKQKTIYPLCKARGHECYCNKYQFSWIIKSRQDGPFKYSQHIIWQKKMNIIYFFREMFTEDSNYWYYSPFLPSRSVRNWRISILHIIIIVTWSGVLYRVEWMRLYHRIIWDAKCWGDPLV